MAKLSEYARTLPRPSVSIDIGGTSYPLRLGINQLISAASITGRPFEQLAPALNDPEVMRAVLWAALQTADPDLSLFDAGELILAVGPETIGEALSSAIVASFPEADKTADPQKAAQDGTGANS